MKEAIFNTEVVNSLKKAGAWAWKIPDMPHFAGSMTRFDVAKPCDIISNFGGRLIAIEGKMSKKFETFGLKRLRPSQIFHLDRIVKTGGRAFVFLNVRIAGKKGPVVRGRWTGSNYENRLIVLDWEAWRTPLEILPLSAKEVANLPYIRGGKGLFDLSGFLKRI